jgi:hypothetical protein
MSSPEITPELFNAINAAPVLIVVQLGDHEFKIARRYGGEQHPEGGPVAVTYRLVAGLPYEREQQACEDAILMLHREAGTPWP